MNPEINSKANETTGVRHLEERLKPIWSAANGGEERAYRTALELMAQALRAYFKRRMTGKPTEVEELVQETLMAIHLKRGTYNPEYPVTAWMFGIARHKSVDFFRAHGMTAALTDNIDDMDEGVLPTIEDTEDTLRDLQTLLSQLPDAQRAAITLTKLEGLSLEEASERTGLSAGAIKVQVHRGLTKLARIVGR